jgi:hypothetical protein
MLIPRCQDAVIERLHERWQDFDDIAVESIPHIWANTCTDSLLRKFILRQCWLLLDVEDMEGRADCLPKELLLDLVIVYKNVDSLDKTLSIDQMAQFGGSPHLGNFISQLRDRRVGKKTRDYTI